MPQPPPVSGAPKPTSAAQTLVDGLQASFIEQVRRALGFELDYEETSLAFVDHHLRQLADEDRAPIIALVSAGAGAYYGEIIKRSIGATWIGDGEDPRRLRLLLQPHFVHFSPVDQAIECVLGGPSEGDPRVPDGPTDGSFSLRTTLEEADDTTESDAAWVLARLDETPPVSARDYHTLTTRFETLRLVLELLSHRSVALGRAPREWGVEDYLRALAANPPADEPSGA